MDWLVLNTNFSCISAILWHEQIFINLKFKFLNYTILRKKTFVYNAIGLYVQINENLKEKAPYM
jgi:hypothetical protein